VHLKELSLVSSKIQSSEIFKAIEVAIPATSIEQAIAKTKVEAERHRSLPAQLVVCAGFSNEPVVKRFNAGCTKKSH
jgi:hypothetical protein